MGIDRIVTVDVKLSAAAIKAIQPAIQRAKPELPGVDGGLRAASWSARSTI